MQGTNDEKMNEAPDATWIAVLTDVECAKMCARWWRSRNGTITKLGAAKRFRRHARRSLMSVSRSQNN
jgi:hypothetical protein